MNQQIDTIFDAISMVGGPGGKLADLLGMCFPLEDEIEKAQARHPDKAEELWDTFKMLYAGLFVEHDEKIYRAHCAELLDRVANREDLEVPTQAELLIMLHESSMEAPLTRTAGAVYIDLFEEIYGHDRLAELGMGAGSRYTDAHPMEKRELLAIMRRRGRVHGRTTKCAGDMYE